MNQKRQWKKYFRHNWFRVRANYVLQKLHISSKISPKYSSRLLSADATGETIREIIEKGEPALVARFGSNEAFCTAMYLGKKYNAIDQIPEPLLERMRTNAGVFPYGEEMAMRFGAISANAAKQVDILGAWSSSMQDYLIDTVCSPSVKCTALGNLEPYNSDTPWSVALKGKKVLVIHPFKDTIESQYKKRELLFDNPDVLPEFDLQVLRAVQTIAGEKDDRFADWEEALEYMYQQAMTLDFDVAIIGCGAYGMPLGAKLKETGKIAIHLGGATQLLFGIRGARWDNHPLARLYNDHWVRPLTSETPQAAKKVENACYW